MNLRLARSEDRGVCVATAPEAHIANELNLRGILTDLGCPWTRATVRQVPSNEKDSGNNVYNRISFKFKKKRARNPGDM